MYVWIFLCIGLGIFNLVGSIYYVDPVIYRVNGYILILMGVALVWRMRQKKREGRVEQLEERLRTLEGPKSPDQA